ncbi:EndoU domain-containing protein [Bacillus rhizoplanae]|uniref:EndoU domain-containing protein n=1 Tax=Bacillus rhizoplanae TaxID=2880966 RepID=UPI003D1A3A5A
MSLNMYLGEVRAQTQSMNALCVATIQGMEQVINSIDAFAFDAVLQGQTYDSAKAFFAQTFRPLAQGIIYLCEELIRQNDAFPNDFQSQVASTDVIEQEILEQIREIERTKAGIEVISSTLPGMQVMVNIFDAMKRKLQEKLEHLHGFNYTSSSNYDTALQLAANIAQGLAEVQSGKGFNAASGTFSTQGLNMGWTASIQKITEDKIRQAKAESKKDESLLDKFKDAVEDRIEATDQASEKIIHTIENTPILGQYYNYKKGQREAVIDELKGLANTVLHPIDSIESAVYALSHLDETFDAVKQAISDSWNQDFVNGDWNSKAKWVGNVNAQAMLAVGELLVGTKGADKISKLGTVSKVGEVSKASESVNFIQGIKNVMNSDTYKQFIDRLNNILMPKNEFAYAGGNVVDSFSDNTALLQAEEKLSTYQFASGGGTNAGNIPYKFDPSLMEHIFHGEVRQKWWGLKAVGYHHENMMGGEIIRVTRPPNSAGVYVAEVEIEGVPKRAKSSFFPKDWNRVQVVTSIKEAYTNRVQIGPNKYLGQTSSGLKIEMIIENGEITTAYPKYTNR